MEDLFYKTVSKDSTNEIIYKILNSRDVICTTSFKTMTNFINDVVKMKITKPITEDFPLLILNMKNVLVINFEYFTQENDLKFNSSIGEILNNLIAKFFQSCKIIAYNSDYVYERNLHNTGFKYYIFYKRDVDTYERKNILKVFSEYLNQSNLNELVISQKYNFYTDFYKTRVIKSISELINERKFLKYSFIIPFNSLMSHEKNIFSIGF